MPVIESSFKPSFYFRSGFISTIFSGLLRRVKIPQKRERINTSDGDFLDLDWSYSKNKTKKLVIILHGMEGHGQRSYVCGIARYLNLNDFDAICVNFRGCSGENNLKFHSFHSGQTKDLEDVIDHVITNFNYKSIYLKGVSLGANIVLKYLGQNSNIPSLIKAAMALSVPIDLAGSAKSLHQFKNLLYHIYFMVGLKKKLNRKRRQFPNKLSRKTLWSIWTLKSMDNKYTSIANGFFDAIDYYNKSSSLPFLNLIRTPVLILNALNDSFLSPTCYPVNVAKKSSYINLEMPKFGGHVGFVLYGGVYYNEKRAYEFFSKFQ